MRWTASVALLLLASFARAQDPGEADRLVRELGDARFEAREKAAGRLMELGPRALEALRRARENPDAEVRARVAALLAPLEREVALQALVQKCQTEQRSRRLRLITLDAVDAPLEKVLSDVTAQTGVPFGTFESDTQAVDFTRRVTLHAKETPAVQVLDQLGASYDREKQLRSYRHERDHRGEKDAVDRAAGEKVNLFKEESPPANAVYTAGARFAFSVRPWAPKGRRLGFIFETQATQDFLGDLEWDVAAIRTDHNLTVETCDLHSPQLVYVADPDLAGAPVTVRGTRRWYCDVPIEIENPKDGDSRRVRAYEIVVKWPSIVARADNPVNEKVIEVCISSKDIEYKIKAGRERPAAGGGRYGGRFGGSENLVHMSSERAWCGCIGQPKKGTRTPPKTTRERAVEARADAGIYSIDDIERIAVRFHLPVEEPFEVTSEPLK